MSHSYDAEFFERPLANRSSAEAVVIVIVGMVAPRSVVDVGCGISVWLAACLKRGSATSLASTETMHLAIDRSSRLTASSWRTSRRPSLSIEGSTAQFPWAPPRAVEYARRDG